MPIDFESVIEWIKTIVIGVFGWGVGFFLPIAAYIGGFFALILGDHYLGVKAAIIKGKEITDEGREKSWSKIQAYSIMIILLHLVDKVIFVPKGVPFGLTWIIAGYFSIQEIRSLLFHVGTITGNNAWALIADKIPVVFKITKKEDGE